MDRLGSMQNPHEVEQNMLLERIIKNAVSSHTDAAQRYCSEPPS